MRSAAHLFNPSPPSGPSHDRSSSAPPGLRRCDVAHTVRVRKGVTLRYGSNVVVMFGRRALARGLAGIVLGSAALASTPAAAQSLTPGAKEAVGALAAVRQADEAETQVVS